MTRDPSPLRAILHAAIARYLTVTPRGVLLGTADAPRSSLVVRLRAHGGARTLYRARRPACRSLDGVRSLTAPDKICAQCPDLSRCTPQVHLELVADGRPYRLLLAHTSARNFLEYIARLNSRHIDPIAVAHRLDVIPRAGWGELRWREAL